MVASMVRGLRKIFFLLVFSATPAFAQAVFSVSTSATAAADIGYAEPTGPITLSAISGTTVASPFLITYSAPITNNAASEITVLGTGNLSGIAPTPLLDFDANAVIINVPAGGTANSLIRISGVRVAIAGHDLNLVTATITSPNPLGNSIAVGQGNPIVISTVAKPFSFDQGDPLEFTNGIAIKHTATLLIREEFPSAFSSSVGVGGQTQPSQIRIIPFPSIPEGVSLTFGASAVYTITGATLTTLSGTAETVPRKDGSTDVVYRYASAVGSEINLEAFEIQVTMNLEPTAKTGAIQFQAELLPIGLETPTPEFPSTDIPRYAERLIPDETELTIGTTELVFPFRIRSDGTYTGISIANPNSYRVSATLTAYDADGAVIAGDGITNPVSITLPARGQYAKIDFEIFGETFNALSPGTIRIVGKAYNLQGFYFFGDMSGPGLDGGTGGITGFSYWRLPLVFREGIAPFNSLELYNPGSSEATVTIQLLDADGSLVASATQSIQAGGMLIRDIKDMVGVELNSFQGGYIKGTSDLPLVVRDYFGNSLESNILVAQTPTVLTSFQIPFFASGGSYSTELTIVNVAPRDPADISLTLINDSGEEIAIDGNPVKFTIPAGAQLTQTVAGLFPALGADLVAGSIRVDVRSIYKGPIPTSPGLIGSVRIAAADGSASAAIPLRIPPLSHFIYSHVAQDSNYFTGVVILNTNSEPATYTLDVYTKEGTLTGSFSSQLQPGEKISKLLFQLIPATAGQLGGYIEITGDLPLTSIYMLGTNDIRSLGTIPAQKLE
jgi:hypothetical protein